jgi:hypothetical protein
MQHEAMLEQSLFMTMMFMNIQGNNCNSQFSLVHQSIPKNPPLQNHRGMNTDTEGKKHEESDGEHEQNC